MVVTTSMMKDITDEVDRAVETHAKSIDKENCHKIFAFRQHRGDIVWSVKTCDKCNRPTLVHADPWGDRCLITGEPATQNVVAEYIDQFNSHKRLKQIVVWVMPDTEQFEEDEDDPPPHQGVGIVVIVIIVVMPIKTTHTTSMTTRSRRMSMWMTMKTKRNNTPTTTTSRPPPTPRNTRTRRTRSRTNQTTKIRRRYLRSQKTGHS